MKIISFILLSVIIKWRAMIMFALSRTAREKGRIRIPVSFNYNYYLIVILFILFKHIFSFFSNFFRNCSDGLTMFTMNVNNVMAC